ncbi:MAG: GDP-L-fucose synthase family protein [Desulfopila sp.]
MEKDARIFVAGHRGMVGTAIVRQLKAAGITTIVTRSHGALDLTDQAEVRKFFHNEKIDRVILAAARVGGIHANSTYPATFIHDNLVIQSNVIDAAFQNGIGDLLFLGSSCIYPKLAPQPMREEYLLTGLLEPTNEPYAIAKIAGIKMCESYNRQYSTRFRSVMPTNLYGPGDNYHLENSHVIPAMMRKYHLASLAAANKAEAIAQDISCYGPIPDDICAAIGYDTATESLDRSHDPRVVLWGTGSPKREFLHVDDMAAACLHVMELDQALFCGDNPSFVNIGYGTDVTIKEVAAMIAEIVGFTGETVYDDSKPDGTPQKLLDTTRMNTLGWQPRLNLLEGLHNTYKAYQQKSSAHKH